MEGRQRSDRFPRHYFRSSDERKTEFHFLKTGVPVFTDRCRATAFADSVFFHYLCKNEGVLLPTEGVRKAQAAPTMCE
jgi:hypothetical protein